MTLRIHELRKSSVQLLNNNRNATPQHPHILNILALYDLSYKISLGALVASYISIAYVICVVFSSPALCTLH